MLLICVDPETLSHLKLIIYRLFTLLHKYNVENFDEPAKPTETVVERYF